MFEAIKNNPKNKFYSINPESIHKAEENMGVLIPKDLCQFYTYVGYGFLETKEYNINRIMGPSFIEEFYLGTGIYNNLEEIDDFRKDMTGKLYFFEANESLFLSMGTTKLNRGKIYYFDDVIAEDINDFLKKYMENERYFLE